MNAIHVDNEFAVIVIWLKITFVGSIKNDTKGNASVPRYISTCARML